MVSEHQIIALIERLEHKIKLLKNACDTAQKRVKLLEERNDTLQNKLQEKETELNELQKKHVIPGKNTPISKELGIIVKDNPSDTDTNAELKQQLDEYIRELERCIAHLSSLS
ncbi:hypothetical protein [Spirosoma sp. KNUC1025]|uniref:hypothetical protein n=1 Tax=Spirosoma sp. KNUC1025 TaxID=2894082 RepID=UPI003868D524|nr:hypothetical protein LN737_07865 [Spirosoma sp. KNUC1025]